jgi:hypothetical protein
MSSATPTAMPMDKYGVPTQKLGVAQCAKLGLGVNYNSSSAGVKF